MSHKIGVIGGDGIGPEVIAEALKVVGAAGVELDTVDYDLGGARYLRDGTILPDSVLDEWRGLDALLLGAVGTPEVPPGVIERGLLLKMRFDLDLYINQRPFVDADKGIDMVVIRENTEGPYVGEGGVLRKGTPHEVATQGSVNTRMGVERCIRYAFELAEARTPQAPHAGAQDQRAHLRRRPVAADVRRGGAPSTPTSAPPTTTSTRPASTSCPTRSATTWSSPTTCSATSSPTSAARCPAASGSPPRATSTRPAPARRCSSPCTARRPTSPARPRPTPLAAVLSAAMMLDFLGEADAAARIRKACADPSAQSGSTPEIGDAVAARV